MHVLVHEALGKVTKRELEASWRSGFSHWRLVPVGDTRAAAYVTKYLTKSALTRVRASQRYGRPDGIVRALAERASRVSQIVNELDKPRLSEKSEQFDTSFNFGLNVQPSDLNMNEVSDHG